MGAGMADFCALATEARPVAEVANMEEFNLYCQCAPLLEKLFR